MTDGLVKRLRARITHSDSGKTCWPDALCDEAADRIEKLETANLKQSLITVDHLSRIEQLEAALREIIGALEDPKGGQHVYDMRNASYIARKALEGKDD